MGRTALGYGLSVLAVALTWAILSVTSTWPGAGATGPLLAFLAAVALAARVGGFGPGLLAIGFSLVVPVLTDPGPWLSAFRFVLLRPETGWFAAEALFLLLLVRPSDIVRQQALFLRRAHDEARTRFLERVSHELRTPLTPVLLGASDSLRDPSTPPALRPFLELTLHNIKLEARLIDELLEIAAQPSRRTHMRLARIFRKQSNRVESSDRLGAALDRSESDRNGGPPFRMWDGTEIDPLSPRHRLRILLVEDDTSTLRLLSRLLQGRGCDVVSAASVAGALQAAVGDFDLVISDIGLPDGNGLDLMRRLQERGPIKAIALTGYGMREVVQASREAGFITHLTKPVDIDQLEKTIEQVTGAECCEPSAKVKAMARP